MFVANKDYVEAQMTLVIDTRTYAAFHRHYKDMLQQRLIILIAFCSTFIEIYIS